MFYSNKDAGFMNLSINEEKNFENTKYKKILNSHKKMMIKNTIKLNKNSINIDSTNNKYSVQVSHNNNRIVVVTSDG